MTPVVSASASRRRSSWSTWYPFLPEITATAAPAEDAARHLPVAERLAAIVRRGRRTGEFDKALPLAWVVTAAIALGHAAGEAVSQGSMRSDAAARALRSSVLRLVGAPGSPAED